MAYSSMLSLSLCFLVLFHGCFAQIEQITSRTQISQRQQQSRYLSDCRINNLNALEPSERRESEAGVSEYWDQNEEQFQCAGVAVVRHTIQRQGLLLPSFSNAPHLMYVVQGRGILGAALPGCPETYQSESSQHGGGRRSQQRRDQHQKVRQVREGDVIALPAGVAHWFYNNGDNQLVLVAFFDNRNEANQLDEFSRKFYLAGNPHQQQQQHQGRHQSRSRSRSPRGSSNSGTNVFSGFDQEILAESFNIDNELARKIQNEDDQRGNIVRVENGLQVLRPGSQDEDEREERRSWGSRDNGQEETFCTMRLKRNIAEPSRADVYNPRGGRITSLNSLNLPILDYLQLSAERGVLYKNALLAPHYNLNSHSVIYVIRGNGRVQVVNENGDNVFDGELSEGQVLTVPQNFAVIKKAGNQGFEWVALKTNDRAVTNTLAGRLSVIRALPEDVLINSYQIQREEARRLKNNRVESVVFSAESGSQH